MERRQFLKGAAFGGVAAASTLATPAIAQGVKRLRMQTTWPRNFPGLGTGANVLAEMINRLSSGSIEIEVLGGGEVVPPFETIDAVEAGTLDMGHGAFYYWKGKVPATEFLGVIPFGFNAAETNAWFRFGGGQELADEAYREMGCKVFLSGNTGNQMGGWFSRPIESIEDYRGLRLRLPGLGGEVSAAAGASVVNLPGGEIPPAMASGALDAAEWVGPYNDLALGMHRSGWYYMYPGWQEPGTGLDHFINLNVWESFSDEEKAIVEAANAYANDYVLSEFMANNNDSLDTLINEHNVELRRFSDETLIALAELSADVLDGLANADSLSRRTYDSILRFRSQAISWASVAEGAMAQARTLDYRFSEPSE
ncbi:MAG: TRAP transporter substrate-binding protein [Salinarimonas sp.]